MSFESVRLNPATARVDMQAVAAHLDSLPWAFRDPLDNTRWCMEANAKRTIRMRQRRTRGDFTLGLLICVHPDHIVIAQCADHDAMARGRQFLQWLLKRDTWHARNDYRDVGQIKSADDLYTSPLPCIEDIGEDELAQPVLEGLLLDLYCGTEMSPEGCRMLRVHSSGHLHAEIRYAEHRISWIGKLHPTHGEALQQIWESLSPDDIDVYPEEMPPQERLVNLSAATPEDEESFTFDLNMIPEQLQDLTAKLTHLHDEISAWTGGPPPRGLQTLNRENR